MFRRRTKRALNASRRSDRILADMMINISDANDEINRLIQTMTLMSTISNKNFSAIADRLGFGMNHEQPRFTTH